MPVVFRLGALNACWEARRLVEVGAATCVVVEAVEHVATCLARLDCLAVLGRVGREAGQGSRRLHHSTVLLRDRLLNIAVSRVGITRQRPRRIITMILLILTEVEVVRNKRHIMNSSRLKVEITHRPRIILNTRLPPLTDNLRLNLLVLCLCLLLLPLLHS